MPMEYHMEENADGLRIQATVPPEQQKKLLEEFSKCSSGTCSCPSTQYEKLESMQVSQDTAGVTVELRAKSGETLDAKDIWRCLDFTGDLIQK
ncbi:MAG: hypothetical protein ABI409_01470 [Ramlibacter sp.]